MPSWNLVAEVTLGVYALLLAVGGWIGYARAGSRPSLIAGFASAGLALLSLALAHFARPAIGQTLGLVVAVLLLGFFTRRFTKSRKFMPGGMMAFLSLVVVVLLAAALMRTGDL